jgi:hypothetical protein
VTSTARPGEAARPIAVDGGEVAEFLMGLPPEWLVPLGAPVWWLNLNVDRPANACLDSALVLREAYAQLGVAAEPKVVVLHAHDCVTGREYVFGTERPRFDGGELVGHLGLWLPGSGWFVDQTAQQFDPVAGQGWLPVLVRRPPGAPWGRGVPAVRRGRFALTYQAVPDEVSRELLDQPVVRAAARRRHRRAGINLAASLLELFRGDGYRERALASTQPRLRRLIRRVGRAPSVVDDDQNLRFVLPGTRGVQLDEID